MMLLKEDEYINYAEDSSASRLHALALTDTNSKIEFMQRECDILKNVQIPNDYKAM